MFRPTKLTRSVILVVALLLSSSEKIQAKTAVLFGATGAVGNEILRALIAKDNDYFTKVILVGRREFPPKVNDLLPKLPSELPEIVKIQVPDLSSVDRHEELAAMETDACFVAVGAATPQDSDLHDWHNVETTMAGAMARLCGKMKATSLTTFTAIEAVVDPEPFTDKELTKTGTPMGWWPVLVGTIRMMGLKEKTIESNSEHIPFVRIFQPSTIITDEIRYGWMDWAFFKFHGVADPWLPTPYHSVTTQLLANAMVEDAVGILSEGNTAGDGNAGEDGVKRFTYGDFLRITGNSEGKKDTEL